MRGTWGWWWFKAVHSMCENSLFKSEDVATDVTVVNVVPWKSRSLFSMFTNGINVLSCDMYCVMHTSGHWCGDQREHLYLLSNHTFITRASHIVLDERKHAIKPGNHHGSRCNALWNVSPCSCVSLWSHLHGVLYVLVMVCSLCAITVLWTRCVARCTLTTHVSVRPMVIRHQICKWVS